ATANGWSWCTRSRTAASLPAGQCLRPASWRRRRRATTACATSSTPCGDRWRVRQGVPGTPLRQEHIMGTRLSNAERTLKRREPFVGRWQLAGFNHDDSSIVEAPHCSWGASVSLVLYASAEELLAQVQPRRG